MDLTIVLAFGALPVLLLGASITLSHAYNRLRTRHQKTELDRNSYLEVLEGSNDALFVINFVNGRIYLANEAAARLLGHPRERLERLTIFDLHPKSLLQHSAKRIADAWESKGLIFEDIPLLAADGREIAVESSVRVSSYAGKPAIILFARDIRERIALQRRVEQQQAVVKRQNSDLLASMRYAQRIQRAVLPEPEGLLDLFPESFILFRPRDIVSGDLFWFAERGGLVTIAAADCTGHGVPGSLLSLIGASLMQETVVERGVTAPGAVLDALREGFMHTLNRNDAATEQRDGMNIGLVTIDRAAGKLFYAGAYGPLYLLREGMLIEEKGDRMPIGQHEGGRNPFKQVDLDLKEGDRIFLFSDGLADQFGGPNGKKLRSAGLKQWLLDTASLSMDEQHQAISDRFRTWKGKEEQVDDVLLIGVQI
jgi:PAS domain S-box-containing protein